MPQRAELRLTAYKWEECANDTQRLCDYVIEEAISVFEEGLDIFPGLDVLEFGVYICKYQTHADHAGMHLLPHRSPPHRWAQVEEELPPCTIYLRFDGKEKTGEFIKASPFQIRSLIGFGMSFGLFSCWLAGLSERRWPGAPTTEEEIEYRKLWRQKVECLKNDPNTPWEEPDSFVEFEDKWLVDAILFERRYALWEADSASIESSELESVCNFVALSIPKREGLLSMSKILVFTLDIEVENSRVTLISNWPGETALLNHAEVAIHFDLLQIRVDVESPNPESNVNVEISITKMLGLLPRDVHLLDTDRLFVRLGLGGISKKLHVPGYRDERFRMWIAMDSPLNLTAADIRQTCLVANLIVNAITLPDPYQEAISRGNVHVTDAIQASFILDERHYLPWIMSLYHFDPILDIPLISLTMDVFRIRLKLSLSSTTQSDFTYMRVLNFKTKILFKSQPKYKTVLHCHSHIIACQATADATLSKQCPAIRLGISTSWLNVTLHSTVVESMLDVSVRLVQGLDEIRIPPVPPPPDAPPMTLVPFYADVRIAGIRINYQTINACAQVENICLITSITKSEFLVLLKIRGVRISSENVQLTQKLPYEHILEWGKLGFDERRTEILLGPIRDVSKVICTPEPGIAVHCGVRCFAPYENTITEAHSMHSRSAGSIAEEPRDNDVECIEPSEYGQHLHSLILGPLWLSADWGTLLRIATDGKAVNEFVANMDSSLSGGTISRTSVFNIRRATDTSTMLLHQHTVDKDPPGSVASDEVEEPLSILSTFGIQGPYLIMADCSIDSIRIFLPADEKSGICFAMSAKVNLSQDIDPQKSDAHELNMYHATINLNMLVSNLLIAVGTAKDMMSSKSPSEITHVLFPSRFEIRMMREVPGYILTDDTTADYNYLGVHSYNSFEIQSTTLNIALNPDVIPKILSVYGTIICHMDVTDAEEEARSDASRFHTIIVDHSEADESQGSAAQDAGTTFINAVPLGKWTSRISVGNVVLQFIEPLRCSSSLDITLEYLIMNGNISKLPLTRQITDAETLDRELKSDCGEYRILSNANICVTASVLGFSPHAGKMVPVIEPVLIEFKNQGPQDFDLSVSWFNINLCLDVTDSFKTGACDIASALDMAYLSAKQTRKVCEQATLENLSPGMRVEPLLADVEGWPLFWKEPGSTVIEIKEDMASVLRPEGAICIAIDDLSIGPELPFHSSARVARLWVCYYDQVKYITHGLLLRQGSAKEPMTQTMLSNSSCADLELDILGRNAQLMNDTGLTIHCIDQHMGRQRKNEDVLPGEHFGVALDEKSGAQLEVIILLPVQVRHGETEIFHVRLDNFTFTSETLQVVERKLVIDSDSQQKKTWCHGVKHLKLTKFVTARILIRTEMAYTSTNHEVYLSSHIHIANRTGLTFLVYSPTSDTPLIVEPSTSRQGIPLHWLLPLEMDPCPMVYFALKDATLVDGNIADFLLANPAADCVHHLVPKRTWRRMFHLRGHDVRDYQQMRGHVKRFTQFQQLQESHHRNQYVDVCTCISATSANMESRSDSLMFVIGIDWALKLCNRLPSKLDIIVQDTIMMPDAPLTPKRADAVTRMSASIQMASVSGARERLRGLAPTEVITIESGDDVEMEYIPKCVRFKLDDVMLMKSVNPFMISDLFKRQRVHEDIPVFFSPAVWKYQEPPPILEVTCEVETVIRITGVGRMQTFSWPSPSRQFLLYAPYWIINRREDCDFFLNVNAPLLDVKSPLMQIPSNTLRLLHDEKPMLRIGVTNCFKLYTEQGTGDIESQMDRTLQGTPQSGPQHVHYMLSDSFRINQVNYDGTVIIPRDEQQVANPIQRWLGYSVDAAPYPFYRTLVVTLCRKFTVVNHKDHPVWIQFTGDHGWQEIRPQQTLPMDPQGESTRGTADIFLSGEPSWCRGPVAHFEVSTFGHFQVRHPIENRWAKHAKFPSTGKFDKRRYCVTMVEISHAVETSASTVIRFLEPIIPEFLLVNSTSTPVTFVPTTAGVNHGVKSLFGKAKITVLQIKTVRQRAELEEPLCLCESSAFYSPSNPANKGKMKIIIENKHHAYDIGVIRLHKEKIEISRQQNTSEDRSITATAIVGSLIRRNFWTGLGTSPNQDGKGDSLHGSSAMDAIRRPDDMGTSRPPSEYPSGLRPLPISQVNDEREDAAMRSSEVSMVGKADSAAKKKITGTSRKKIVFHVRTLIVMGVREVHVFNTYTFRNDGNNPIILKQSGGEQGTLYSGSPVALDKLEGHFQFSLSEDTFSDTIVTPQEASCKLDTTRFLSIPLTRQSLLPFSEADYAICKLRIIYDPSPGKWEFCLNANRGGIPPYVISNQTDFDLLVCDAGHGISGVIMEYWIGVETGKSVPFALFHCDTSSKAMRQAKLNHGMLNVRIAEEADTIKLIHLKLISSKEDILHALFPNLDIFYSLRRIGDFENSSVLVNIEHHTTHPRPAVRRTSVAHAQHGILRRMRKQVTFPHIERSFSAMPSITSNTIMPMALPFSKSEDFGAPGALIALVNETQEANEKQKLDAASQRTSGHRKHLSAIRSHVLRSSSDYVLTSGSDIFESEEHSGSGISRRFSSSKNADVETKGEDKSCVSSVLKSRHHTLHKLAVRGVSLTIKLEGVGVSLNDNYIPEEVAFFCLSKIAIVFVRTVSNATNEHHISASLNVKKIHLDVERGDIRVPTLYIQKSIVGKEEPFIDLNFELLVAETFSSLKTANIRISHLVIELDSKSVFQVFRWVSATYNQVDLGFWTGAQSDRAIRTIRRGDPTDAKLCAVTFEFEKTDYRVQAKPLVIEHLFLRKLRILVSARFANINMEHFYTDDQEALQTFYKISRRFLLIDVSNAEINVGVISTVRGVSDLEWNSVFVRTAALIPERLFHDVKKSLFLALVLTLGAPRLIGNPHVLFRQIKHALSVLRNSSSKKSDDDENGSIQTFGDFMRNMLDYPRRFIAAIILIFLAFFDSLAGVFAVISRLATRFAAGGLPDCSQTRATSVSQALREGFAFGIPWNWYKAVQIFQHQLKRLFHSGIALKGVFHVLDLFLIGPRLFVGFFAGMIFFGVKCHEGSVVILHYIVKALHPSICEALNPPALIRDPNTFRSFRLEGHNEAAACCYAVLLKKIPNLGTEMWSFIYLSDSLDSAGKPTTASSATSFVWVEKHGLFYIQKKRVVWKFAVHNVYKAEIMVNDPTAIMFEGNDGQVVGAPGKKAELHVETEQLAVEIFVKSSEFIHYRLKQKTWKSGMYRRRKFAEYGRPITVD
eukprot:GEMP01000047.1.p1 GENE.GEMP01000047.1~~GEMP01000047.1.p1  ORF type:complete len:3542 (-),score=605.39 GEMP01000047.1:1875-11624(-)